MYCFEVVCTNKVVGLGGTWASTTGTTMQTLLSDLQLLSIIDLGLFDAANQPQWSRTGGIPVETSGASHITRRSGLTRDPVYGYLTYSHSEYSDLWFSQGT